MARYHEPIRGKGLQEMLIGQGFTVYLIDEYCTSTFSPACESRMEKFHKIDDPHLQDPKNKYHVAMAAAASNFVTASTNTAANSVAAATSFNCVAAATTSATASIIAATAISVATKTAANATSVVNSAQQSHNQRVSICPQSADIIRLIGEEKGWSKRNISRKIKQQLGDELAERNRKHCVNIQLADNPKRFFRLSGWSRGKIERKIRQRVRDKLAAQQQKQ
ncbi:hypothetical protein GGF37_001119 [Kickxella alabastrina]|nr:hypothetical protein GGF37_001119 [Kickxella alabastrina]